MAGKPNILIFMTDHQRGDTVLPGHPAITPQAVRLGEQGVTFTETFCPTPHCCPARATFFSGLYPTRSGVWNNICNGQRLSPGLNPDVALFSDFLAEAGYRQVFTGKWHVDTQSGPSDHGFEELVPVSATKGAFHGMPWERFEEMAAQTQPRTRGDGEILRPGWGTYRLYGTRPSDQITHDDRVTNSAEAALRELLGSDQPWCLYAGAIGPHDPYVVPQSYLDLYKVEDIALPPSYADEMTGKPAVVRRMRKQLWDQLSETEIRQGIRHFRAYCTYLDDLFGRLLELLDASNQRDDTLVLYTSDHGDYCGDHGLFAKGIPCYRGAYHVPAVARWPNGIRNPGRQVDDFVSLADFAPTFCEIAGAKPRQRFTGRSLVPLLRDDRPDDWRDAIFTQCNGVELYYSQRSVTTKEFKFIYNGFDDDELYDLRTDPHELNNLAANPDYNAVVRDMMRRIWLFARAEEDSMINPYITVGLAPFGPAVAFEP